MSKFKFTVIFALIVGAAGSFSQTANAQVGSYGSFSYPVPGAWWSPNYPTLDKPSSNRNNSSPKRISAPSASGYNSRFTRSYIHKLATKNAGLRQLLQGTLCGNNAPITIEGTRVSSEEAEMLREE
jgi:hypothetical protein